MRFCIVLSVFAAALVAVECSHTFLGTNVLKHLVYHRQVKYSAKTFKKRIEYLNYTMPATFGFGSTIQGILAYDLLNSSASANVTAGGIGYPYVSLSMKNEKSSGVRYDVYIYA